MKRAREEVRAAAAEANEAALKVVTRAKRIVEMLKEREKAELTPECADKRNPD